MSKSEALRLADELEDDLADYGGQSLPRISQDIADNAAAELRRLYADNFSLIVVNKAFAERQEWWNERMFALETQRNQLLEALRSIADCCDEEHAARDYASRQAEIRGIARAAIAKAEGQ